MSLVMDLCITHERWGSNSNPSLNDHLYYPADIDRTLNETVVDKVIQYRSDYNNRPSHDIVIIPVMDSTSLVVYTETLCVFYFHRFIGKLTAFLYLQEFS